MTETPAPTELSPREKEIFDLLLDGKAPKAHSIQRTRKGISYHIPPFSKLMI
jgi:DNA-binding CsgD family transcriptional regulator